MNKKRFLAFVMSVVMFITIMPFGTVGVIATEGETVVEDSEFSPLEIKVKTDKQSYSSIATATFTVIVKNVSDKKVDKICVASDFNDLQPVSGNLSAENKTLNPDESFKYSYSATISPRRLNLLSRIILIIKNIFEGTKQVPDVKYEEGSINTLETFEVRFGSIVVEDTVNAWFKYPTEVIETNDKTEFDKELSNLVESKMEMDSFDKNKALNEEYYSQRIIVEGQALNKIDLKEYDPETVIYNEDNTTAVIQCMSQSAAEKCEKKLNANSNVEFAEVDKIMTTCAEPNSLTWGKSYIKADSYEHYLENNNYFDMITVAVVDSGVDMDHSYLNNRLTSNGYDFVNVDTDPDDDYGHGTHVAGIIASCTSGLNVKILPIKVMNDKGMGSSYIIARGIKKAANDGAKVINLSIGGSKSKVLNDTVEYAITEKNAVVCIAAGNGDEKGNPVNTVEVSPACVTDAIVVAALDSNGNAASFSNYGSSVDVAAPGVGVYSTYNDGSYAKMSGTSMAAPHIAAVAAMFKLANPSFTPAQIEELIIKYCKDLGATGRDDIYGYGTVNMYNAIPDCTVKFNTNGGSASGDKNVKSTDEITLPKPTKSYTVKLNANGGSISTSSYTRNCTLEGWYKSSSLTGTRYAPGGLYMARNSETLYAKWTNPTLGDVNKPSRTYYQFDGWYTAASGGSKVTNTSTITGNTILYAHWTELPVRIPDFNGWDIESAKQSLESLGVRYTVSTGYNGNYASGKVYQQSVIGNVYRSSTVVNLTYCTGTVHYRYYHRYGPNYQGKWVWGSDDTLSKGARHEIDITYPLSVKYQATLSWYGDYTCPQCGAVHMWLPAGTYIG